MTLAAIDIGSNAARLLISEAHPYGTEGGVDYTKLLLLRVPLRLGIDVFQDGRIGPEREHNFVETLKAYRIMMGIYKVEAYRACATSAMRDAANGPELLARAKAECGVDISIISGQEEAAIVYETHIAEALSTGKDYLYIDVGGGSTELTLFSDNKIVFKESFNIGTIRLLSGKVPDEAWSQLKDFIKSNVRRRRPVQAIGSGGNINKVFSMSKRKEGQPLPIELLRDYYKEMSAMELEERMHRYDLRADRADVIVPALHIYLNVMRWADSPQIFVPRVGLADGLIKMLYRERTRG